MKREHSHLGIARRQQRFAWMILLVYVPMVLLSSMHVHSLHEYAEVVDCNLCETSAHHSGHITISPQQHGECLSCRFLTTQVDIPEGVFCLVDNQVVSKLESFQATEPVFPKVAHPSLRAPPCIL